MKKLFFALACVVGLMTFAGCTQEQINELLEQKPTVEFVAADGYIATNTSVYVGTELKFQVKIAPNSGSEAALAHFDFSITDLTGATVFNENPTITNPDGESTYEFSFTPQAASTYLVTATVTDANSKANIAELTVDYVPVVVAEMGTYEGSLNIAGQLTSDEYLGQSLNEAVEYSDLPISIILGAIDDNNRVSATIEIEGSPVTLYATMTDNVMTFDEFHFNKTITAILEVTLDLTMNITGTMDGNTLTLEGTAVGSGSTPVLMTTFNVNLEGTTAGTLTKVEE